MLIGVLSDSHGRAEVTEQAVKALVGQGAEALLHLGDLGTEQVIDTLVGRNARIVFGNCDVGAKRLRRHAEQVGVEVCHPMGQIEVCSKRVAFTHGHLARLMREAMEAGVDYLLHGHSHLTRDERRGPTRIINPGALFRAPRYTAALLDPARDNLRFLEIPTRPPGHEDGRGQQEQVQT
ncbi:MAG: YfcE family phosphodiesterase [Planctomycetota bacterium]|jgi:putative phosphoesterase